MEPTFTTRWFYHALEGKIVSPGAHLCSVCGLPTAETELRSKVLRKTFSDYDVLRIRSGKYVCPACVWYMDHQALRLKSWWLTQREARSVQRTEWLKLLQDHIQEPPDEEGYYLIRKPGPIGKHLALLAPLNLAGHPVRRVQFDRQTLSLDREWLSLVEASHCLREYFSWREILRDCYESKVLSELSIEEVMALRKVVKPWLGTAHLELAIQLWTKEEGDE